MSNIKLLDQNTINQIAAGEVIDRPASIVKELMENSIDAGADKISVEIKDGGTKLIRITDNGCGIDRDDIKTAFLRHATSKIKSVEDLMVVSSLGFRGEALSSIAAVCQVELITKTQDSFVGCKYTIEGGKEKGLEEIGAPDGTTFLVRNIFFNTPARRKFLKTPQTEAGYISEIVERIALSHPEIAINFINNGQPKLHTPGNGNLKDVIYNIYGREITNNLIEINEELSLNDIKELKEARRKEEEQIIALVEKENEELRNKKQEEIEYNDTEYRPPIEVEGYIPENNEEKIEQLEQNKEYILGKPSKAKEKYIKIKEITANERKSDIGRKNCV